MRQALRSLATLSTTLLAGALVVGCATRPPPKNEGLFLNAQAWDVIGCQIPIPSRFEVEYYEDNTARATDVGEGQYLGGLAAGAAADPETFGKYDVYLRHDYDQVQAFLIRDPTPGLDKVVVGIIRGPLEGQEVVLNGPIVHYIGVLAEGCASSVQ